MSALPQDSMNTIFIRYLEVLKMTFNCYVILIVSFNSMQGQQVKAGTVLKFDEHIGRNQLRNIYSFFENLIFVFIAIKI